MADEETCGAEEQTQDDGDDEFTDEKADDRPQRESEEAEAKPPPLPFQRRGQLHVGREGDRPLAALGELDRLDEADRFRQLRVALGELVRGHAKLLA